MDARQKSLRESLCFSMTVLEKAKENWGLESVSKDMQLRVQTKVLSWGSGLSILYL